MVPRIPLPFLLRWILIIVAAVCWTLPAAAQDRPRSGEGGQSLPPAEEPKTYGPVGSTAVWIPAAAFHPHDSGVTWVRTGGVGAGAIGRTGGTGQFWAEVNLPNGATVDRVEIHHFDNDATNGGFHCLTRYDVDDSFNNQETCQPFPAGTPGMTSLGFVPAASIRVIDNRYPYAVHVYVDGNHPVYYFWGVRIVYRLNVSPAPLVATYPVDVPTGHPIFRFVEALARSGITAGCGAGSFCPDQPVTRGQMAVFLAAALGLHFPDAALVP